MYLHHPSSPVAAGGERARPSHSSALQLWRPSLLSASYLQLPTTTCPMLATCPVRLTLPVRSHVPSASRFSRMAAPSRALDTNLT